MERNGPVLKEILQIGDRRLERWLADAFGQILHDPSGIGPLRAARRAGRPFPNTQQHWFFADRKPGKGKRVPAGR
jgi:hypothetical protein